MINVLKYLVTIKVNTKYRKCIVISYLNRYHHVAYEQFTSYILLYSVHIKMTNCATKNFFTAPHTL